MKFADTWIQAETMVDKIVRNLYDYSLIRITSQNSISVHRLVQKIVRQYYISATLTATSKSYHFPLDGIHSLDTLIDSILDGINAFLDKDNHRECDCQGNKLNHIMIPHLLSLDLHLRSFKDNKKIYKKFPFILLKCAEKLLLVEHNHNQAITLLEKSIEWIVDEPNNDLNKLSMIYNYLGYAYYFKGNELLGKKYSERGLYYAEKLPKQEGNVSIAFALRTLGHLEYGFGNVQKSKDHYRNALKRFKKEYGNQNQPEIGTTYRVLGHIARHEKKYPLANLYYNRSLKILESITDTPMKAEIALTWHSLGNFNTVQNKPDMSKHFYEKALKYYNELYSAEDPHREKLAVLNNLGCLCAREKKFEEAKNYFTLSLDIGKKLYIEKAHPVILPRFNRHLLLLNYELNKEVLNASKKIYKRVQTRSCQPSIKIPIN